MKMVRPGANIRTKPVVVDRTDEGKSGTTKTPFEAIGDLCGAAAAPFPRLVQPRCHTLKHSLSRGRLIGCSSVSVVCTPGTTERCVYSLLSIFRRT